jgi:hypothetical protein
VQALQRLSCFVFLGSTVGVRRSSVYYDNNTPLIAGAERSAWDQWAFCFD